MNQEKMAEEIFCLRYELRLLSNLLIEGKTERWVEGCVYPNTQLEHIQRYELLSRFTKGKQVLDLACGSGRGSYMLALEGDAASVSACDIESDAIRYASCRYAHANIQHRVVDGLNFLDPDRFDVVACFETIEHVSDPERLLRNFAASLKPDGLLFVSTPVSRYAVDTRPNNPYHVQEWGFSQFQELVSKTFKVVDVYLQYQYWPTGYSLFAAVQRRLNKLRRTVLPGPPDLSVEQKPQLAEWGSLKIDLSTVGKSWHGFQILACTPLR